MRKKVKLNNLYFFHRCWSCAWWKLRCRLSLSRSCLALPASPVSPSKRRRWRIWWKNCMRESSSSSSEPNPSTITNFFCLLFLTLFYVILIFSVVLFWVSSRLLSNDWHTEVGNEVFYENNFTTPSTRVWLLEIEIYKMLEVEWAARIWRFVKLLVSDCRFYVCWEFWMFLKKALF